MDWAGATVVVTGASRGIGRAVAIAAAAKGARVGLIARSADDLRSVLAALGGRGAMAVADVAEPAQLATAIATLEAELGPVDVLVANAGIGAYGAFADVSAEKLERLVRVNVLGTAHAIRLVVPGMIQRRRGHIVTIGSIAGRIGSPFEAVYSATKFAGVGLTEALAPELAPYGIGVSLVNPGPVATAFGEARGHPYDRARPRPVPAEAVAAAVVEAVEDGRPEAYVPPSFRPAVITRHLVPSLFRWGVRRSFARELAADQATRGGVGTVALLCAMPMELRPLTRRLRLQKDQVGGVTVRSGRLGDHDAVAMVTGMGPRLATEATERLLDAVTPDRVVVVGITGAVDDETPIGTLVVPEVVVDGATGREYQPQRLGRQEPAGKMWTTDIITPPGELAGLRARGVVALDMETAAIAACCERRGIPWSVFRAISDRATDGSVDEDVFALSHQDGTPNGPAILRYVLRHPKRVPRLASLAKGSQRATERAAAAAVDAVLSDAPAARPPSGGLDGAGAVSPRSP